MKLCSRCRLTKPRSDFRRDRSRPDGLSYWCSSCHSAYRTSDQAKGGSVFIVEPINAGSPEDLFNRATPECPLCGGLGRLDGTLGRRFACPCTATDVRLIRFWAHVDRYDGRDGCWTWTGATMDNGYGRSRNPWQHRNDLAHRLAYTIAYGAPTERVVRHACDNRSCCNPAHLIEGTHVDNMRDMYERGRQAPTDRTSHPGEQNHTAKLTADQVNTIRRRVLLDRECVADLARELAMHDSTIRAIVRGERWQSVPWPDGVDPSMYEVNSGRFKHRGQAVSAANRRRRGAA